MTSVFSELALNLSCFLYSLPVILLHRFKDNNDLNTSIILFLLTEGSRLFSCLQESQDDDEVIDNPSKTSHFIIPKEIPTVQSITKDLQTFELNPVSIKSHSKVVLYI